MSEAQGTSTCSTQVHEAGVMRCVICHDVAVIFLRKDDKHNQSCAKHLAEAENLLRISEAYFAGPTF